MRRSNDKWSWPKQQTWEDGWTLRVPDRSFAAQQEHAIIITRDRPIIVTAA
jgi:methionine aminopeptidase